MLNNARLCRLPLLPNNIPITDSGFENVNAFNAVTPRSHQKKKKRERTRSRNKHGQSGVAPVQAHRHAKTLRETRQLTCYTLYETDMHSLLRPRTHTHTHAARLRGSSLLIVSGSLVLSNQITHTHAHAVLQLSVACFQSYSQSDASPTKQCWQSRR